MTNYGITRGFFLIRPGQIPEGKEEIASLLDGVSRYWKHQTLAQLKEAVGHIDMMVTGRFRDYAQRHPLRQGARLFRP